jgi:hypothetical protein
MKSNMSLVKDEEEQEIYENTKIDYDRRINFLVKEIENLNE